MKLGMGFRKAIEYLIKDYLINKDENLSNIIQDMALSKVINEYYTDDDEKVLKELLIRATWFGNDMTHYLKYHDNFDITGLKELIRLVMDEMNSISQKRYYTENIQSKYKK